MAKPIQHQIVARALEIISDEQHWTRASIARTVDGWPCTCLDPLAYRFCAVGALYRAAVELVGGNWFEQVFKTEKYVLGANRQHVGLSYINDVNGRETVVAMFKVALAQ